LKLPIRGRLTAWYAVFLTATLGALGAFLVLELRSDLRSTIDREVSASSFAIRQTYVDEGMTGFKEISAATLRRSGALAQILGPAEQVIASSGGDLAQDPMLSPGAQAEAMRAVRPPRTIRLGDSGQSYRMASTPVALHGQRQIVVVGESLQGANEAVRRILVLLLIAGPIVLAATALAAWLLLRKALLPVDRMRQKAEIIGIDRLNERLSVSFTGDELGQLAATLNAMLDRLEAGVLARRQLVADASHELRTPLAAMRAELDVGIRDRNRTESERAVLASVRDDVDRMSRTVDNLMTLARADDGRLELGRSEMDLDELVRSAVSPLQALAAAKQVSVTTSGEPTPVRADPHRLHQALTNLIENAIKYTARDGEVVVSTWRNDHEAGVTVRDNGMGIPREAQAHVFDRFYRADRSRSRESGGSGLGLAICYEIATAHGGRIWVESEEGVGSTFSIALPADPAEVAGPAAGPPAPVGQRPGR
jgi:heavy metal sensor kinase